MFQLRGGCYAKVIAFVRTRSPRFIAPPDVAPSGERGLDPAHEGGETSTPTASPKIPEPAIRSTPSPIICPAAPAASKERGVSRRRRLRGDAPIARHAGRRMYHFLRGTRQRCGHRARGDRALGHILSLLGAHFLPLHAGVYARMLGERIAKHGTKVWLVNTAGPVGAYGTARG